MLNNFVVKNSFPLFLVTLMVTSQFSGLKLTKAHDECCPCDDDSLVKSTVASLVAGGLAYLAGPGVARWFGAREEGIQKGSIASMMQRFASKTGGKGSEVVSNLQRAGTQGGNPRMAADMASKAFRAANNRCCPCRSATGDL